MVFSAHVIEHVPKPFSMVKEMVRVSSREVKVVCPHRFANGYWITWKGNGYHWTKKHHINNMTFNWFLVAGKLLNCKSRVTASAVYWFPFVSFHLFNIPIEITARYHKHVDRPKLY